MSGARMPRRLRATVLAALAAVAIVAVARLVGQPWSDALIYGGVWAVICGIGLHLPLGEVVDLPRPRRQSQGGARRDVSSLTWSMGAQAGTSTEARRRLRSTGMSVLALHGLDPEAEGGTNAAAGLLGAPMASVIFDLAAPPPSARAFAQAVAALERLVPERSTR